MKRRILLALTILCLFSGCLYSTPTFVDPKEGFYFFSGDACLFEVAKENGIKFLRFSRDCRRGDRIVILNGAFSYQWGQIAGTHCPTDGYILNGHFASETRAEGYIYYCVSCQIVSGEVFVAELQEINGEGEEKQENEIPIIGPVEEE